MSPVAERPKATVPTAREIIAKSRERVDAAVLDSDVKVIRREQLRMALATTDSITRETGHALDFAAAEYARLRWAEVVGRIVANRTHGVRA